MTASPHLLPHGPSYRQLNVWVTRGLLKPGNAGMGTGYPLLWTRAEAQVAVDMARLTQAGLAPDVAGRVARGETEIAAGITVTITRPGAIA
jgi:hypothetical protein